MGPARCDQLGQEHARGYENQCRLLQRGDGGDANMRFAAARGQDDQTAPAIQRPATQRILLIGTQREDWVKVFRDDVWQGLGNVPEFRNGVQSFAQGWHSYIP